MTLYDNTDAPIPQWVKALSERERLDQGFYNGWTIDVPIETQNKWQIAALAALVVACIALILGHPWLATIAAAGAAYSVVKSFQKVPEYRRSTWTDQAIANVLVKEQENVTRANELARELDEFTRGISVPQGFGVSSWQPRWPLKRPGRDGFVEWVAVVSYGGESIDLVTGRYDTREGNTTRDVLFKRVTGHVKDGIDALRAKLRIIP